jgi:hypothetical protein
VWNILEISKGSTMNESWEIGFKGCIMDEKLHLVDGILTKKVAINEWMDGCKHGKVNPKNKDIHF